MQKMTADFKAEFFRQLQARGERAIFII